MPPFDKTILGIDRSAAAILGALDGTWQLPLRSV
jgi:hypothetical protein